MPKVVDSIPTVVRHIFQLARCGYKLRITPQTLFSPGCITPTFIRIMIAEGFFNFCIKDIMELKTMKGLALDDILAEVHTYVHRGKRLPVYNPVYPGGEGACQH